MTQKNQTAAVEVIVSSIEAAHIVGAEALDGARTCYLHLAPGGRWVMRKNVGKVAKERPYTFDPSTATVRYTVTVDDVLAYLAADSVAARAAVLEAAGAVGKASPDPDAGKPAGTRGSKVTPEAERVAAMLDTFDAAAPVVNGAPDPLYGRTMLAAGILAVPAKPRKAGTSSGAKSAPDTTDAVWASLRSAK